MGIQGVLIRYGGVALSSCSSCADSSGVRDPMVFGHLDAGVSKSGWSCRLELPLLCV